MEFGRSTQSRSWLFDTITLALCREHCDAVTAWRSGENYVWTSVGLTNSATLASRKANKFASGFDRRYRTGDFEPTALLNHDETFNGGYMPKLSPEENNSILRFHANQICKLVGPSALFPQLRRSSNVVATAIMLFRRFYLSNSVLDFDCRHLATAAVMLASKVEEEKIEIRSLAYATLCIYRKARGTPLYSNELKAISVEGIKTAERTLLEGINYEMVCFHPTETARLLSTELCSYFSSRTCHHILSKFAHRLSEDVHCRAEAVCYRALVCSDAPFLFAPDKIAFAATTIALQSIRCDGLTGNEMEDFLRFRSPDSSEQELQEWNDVINDIVVFLKQCPQMELRGSYEDRHFQVWNEVEELQKALLKLAHIQSFPPQPPAALLPLACKRQQQQLRTLTVTTEPLRKRSRLELQKSIKVTPISQQ